MIIIAILIYLVGHFFIPRLILKSKLKDIRKQLSWRNVFIEMTGSIFSFFIALLIITIVTLSSHERYLLNDNAIYGIQCESLAKEIGFKDGDKIISINNKKIDKFSDIILQIVLEPNTAVKVLRGTDELVIDISDGQKMEIMKSESSLSFFNPRLHPDTTESAEIETLIYNESRKNLKDAIETFRTSLKMTISLFLPDQSVYESVGGFVTISNVSSLKGMFFSLALTCIFLGFINFFPIPGLDLGNAMIANIEKLRNRKFKESIIRVIKIASVGLFVLIILYKIYWP